MKELILAPEARSDLKEIWSYIAVDSTSSADRLPERLRQAILRISESPGIGHTRKDLTDNARLRFLPVGNYLVLYVSLASAVRVVAVVHGNRDIPAFIERRGI